MPTRLSLLSNEIREVAPIHGVQAGNPPVIEFKPEATQQQRDDAQAVLNSFNLTPQRNRPVADVYADIQALPNSDFKKLTAAALVFFLREHPRVAKKFGINIEPTEDDV